MEKIMMIVVGLVLAFLFLHVLALHKIFVSYVRDNNVGYIMRGKTIVRLLWAKRGMKFNEKNREWEPDKKNKMNTSRTIGPLDWFLWHTLGMRVIGIPPFFSLDRWHYIWSTYKKDDPRADATGI